MQTVEPYSREHRIKKSSYYWHNRLSKQSGPTNFVAVNIDGNQSTDVIVNILNDMSIKF